MLITQDQARKRFIVIPLSLQDAVFSTQNAAIIADVATDNDLNDDQALKLPEVVGWLMLGFLHLEDLPKQLQEDLLVPQQTALAITSSLTNKIFSLIKNDLDKTYAPVPMEKEDSTGVGPKIVEEIKIAQTFSVPPSASMPITPPRPTSSSLAVSTSKAEKPTPPFGSAPEINVPKMVSPSTPSRPMVLQTESVPRPILNAPSFKMPTIAEDVMGMKKNSAPLSAKPAVVEFGSMPAPRSVMPSLKITPATPSPSKPFSPVTPPVAEPSRTVTEVTLGTQKSISPTPQTPPRPTFTPLSQIPVPSPTKSNSQLPSAPPQPKPSSPTSIPAPLTPPIPPKPTL